jgi:hypothetical protein
VHTSTLSPTNSALPAKKIEVAESTLFELRRYSAHLFLFGMGTILIGVITEALLRRPSDLIPFGVIIAALAAGAFGVSLTFLVKGEPIPEGNPYQETK